MLDNILNSVKRSAEKVQRRGEEVAQSAKLRVEIYQLSRELDGLYARLGRAFHADADDKILSELRQDVGRLDEEIAAREQLIIELSEVSGQEQADAHINHAEAVQAAAERTRYSETTQASTAPTIVQILRTNAETGTEVKVEQELSAATAATTQPNLGDLLDLSSDTRHPVPPSDAPISAAATAPRRTTPSLSTAPSYAPQVAEGSAELSTPTAIVERNASGAVPTEASRIWRAKEEARMTDEPNIGTTEVNPAGPDGENVGMDLGKELPDRKDYSGVGDEAERDKMRRHPFTLKEGDKAERNPDPLDK